MSVGGRVIESLRVSDKEVWVNTCDKSKHANEGHYGGKCNECAIRVKAPDDEIEVGDSLWWQGQCIYWTPHSDPEDDRVEVVLVRGGFSHFPTDDVRADIEKEARDYRASQVLKTLNR